MIVRSRSRLRLPRGLAALLVLLAGCAGAPPSTDRPYDCTAWLADAEGRVTAAGVRDVQAARVVEAPHLRVDRLLAAFAEEGVSGAAFDAWLRRAAALARTGWRVELANLPEDGRGALAAVAPHGSGAIEDVLDVCLGRLVARTRDDPAGHAALLGAARVPDAYVEGLRWLGLYPLTRFPVLAGYSRWRDDMDGLHALSLAQLPVAGRLQRYTTTPVAAAGTPVAVPWTRDALGYPLLEGPDLDALFAAHAPLWEIDVVGDDDRPGAPGWPVEGRHPAVDVARPTLYRHLSHTRVAGRVLPQLNYVAWFSARTARGPFDIYAGRLDGLIFRVTLDDDGVPLLYDAIHPCGCYQMFMPTRRLAVRSDAAESGEGFYVPQQAPERHPGERLVVRLQAGTHQLLRLYTVPSAGVSATLPLRWASLDSLRSLPRPPGRRSLYGGDGLVPGTARAERWLLWPMGVPSAGAMRQWGHHATAFVGRRHFDDPGLVEAGFDYPHAGQAAASSAIRERTDDLHAQ